MLKEGHKIDDFTLEDDNGVLIKVFPKVSPAEHAQEVLQYL